MSRLQATFATIRRVQQEANIEAISLLNFVVSDGVTMVATRFASDPDEAPASLYYAEGGKYQRAADSATPNGQTDAAAPGDDAAANAQTARRTSLTGEVQIIDIRPSATIFCPFSRGFVSI